MSGLESDPFREDRGSGSKGTSSEPEGPSALRRVLTTKVPLWVLLALVSAIGMILSIALVVQGQSAIELGPVVGASDRVEVQLTVCNSEIDRLSINPRSAELDLEKLLADEGAAEVDVRVDRLDCSRPATSIVP